MRGNIFTHNYLEPSIKIFEMTQILILVTMSFCNIYEESVKPRSLYKMVLNVMEHCVIIGYELDNCALIGHNKACGFISQRCFCS